MGSVKFETRNDGRGLREWDYVSLSEERTIEHLIRNRSKQDESFHPTIFNGGGITESNGVFPFSEPVLVTYIDLDRLIKKAPLSKAERATVDLVMMGYTYLDLEQIYGKSRKSFETLVKRACRKLKEQNDEDWREAYASRSCFARNNKRPRQAGALEPEDCGS